MHDRRALRLPVTVTHAATGWQCDARVVNIGLGGACLELPQPLEPGERAVVALMAPSLWDPLNLRVKVAWSRSAGGTPPTVQAGVTFEHADPSLVLALFHLIADAAY